MSHKLLLLPGDGIGVEVMGEVEKLIAWLNKEGKADFVTDTGLVGGSAYDKHGVAVSEEDMQKALAADAVIFGAVGGPKWDKVAYEVRPEAGLLRLFQPEIIDLIRRRDDAVEARGRANPRGDALEDRSLEVTASIDISVERRLRQLRRSLGA